MEKELKNIPVFHYLCLNLFSAIIFFFIILFITKVSYYHYAKIYEGK